MKKRMMLMVLFAALLSFPGVDPVSAALSSNLDNVIVYPNPCKAKLGQNNITFGNLTASVRLRIYKKTGELIYDKELAAGGGNAAWDIKNNDGYPVASGIYVYLITNSSGQSNKGRLAILK